MADFTSYAEVSKLPVQRIRQLLRDGDDPERVWAAWALGSLHCADTKSLARDMVADDPATGLRLNSLVFVAGSGDVDVLEAFAAGDPDSGVRRSACQYLGRIAKDVTARNRVLETIVLADSSEETKRSAMRDAIRDRRELGEAFLLELMNSSDAETRGLVLDCIDAGLWTETNPRQSATHLLNWATRENDTTILTRLCSLMWRTEGGAAVLKVAKLLSGKTSVPLNVLVEKRATFSWSELSETAECANPKAAARVVDLLGRQEHPEAVVWLIEIVWRGVNGEAAWSGYRYELTERLFSRLEHCNDARPTRAAAHLLAAIRQELASWESGAEDEWADESEVEGQCTYLKELVRRLEPWAF